MRILLAGQNPRFHDRNVQVNKRTNRDAPSQIFQAPFHENEIGVLRIYFKVPDIRMSLFGAINRFFRAACHFSSLTLSYSRFSPAPAASASRQRSPKASISGSNSGPVFVPPRRCEAVRPALLSIHTKPFNKPRQGGNNITKSIPLAMLKHDRTQ